MASAAPHRLVGSALAAALAASLSVAACGANGGFGPDSPRPESALTERLPLSAPRPEFHAGAHVGLYLVDAGRNYESLLWELAANGANSVSFVVAWQQTDIRSADLQPAPGLTPADGDLIVALDWAQRLGLRTFLLPIIDVRDRAPGEWRGRMAPADPEAWWTAYGSFVGHYANLGAAHGLDMLAVGSELATMEAEADRWRALISGIRARFPGELTYSANWDHYDRTPFWDSLDVIGVSGYYELTSSADLVPTHEELVAAWQPVEDRLTALATSQGKPLIFTELGYYSQTGAAWHPWDYTAARPVDLRSQWELFRAFHAVWHDNPSLAGVYVWNWFGEGGVTDPTYTPRNKPAVRLLRRWYQDLAGRPR